MSGPPTEPAQTPTQQEPILEQDVVHTPLDAKLKEAEVELEDTKLRYLAYAVRVKTAIAAGVRYLAYTSDVGEAFRPVVHRNLVRAAYGLSWGYVVTDVAVETLRERERGSDSNIILRTATKRALFQSTASMIFPMITIHQTVHLASYIMKKFGKSNRWIPTAAGLAMIPALPFMFDHPMEHLIDTAYDKYWPVPGEHLGHSTHRHEKTE